MSVPIYIAIFAFGVLLGLIFGPASEREEARYFDGWLDGYTARKDRRP